jgi:hypothetical protein
MAVNASWPGVSRKTTRRPSLVTSLAPMCWVMPPRSPAATVVERMASRRLVCRSTWSDGHDQAQSRSASSTPEELLAVSSPAVGTVLGPFTLGAGVRRPVPVAGDERRGTIDELVDGREDAALDELADDVRRIDAEQVGELLDGDRRGQLDRAALARIDRLDAGAAERAIPARRLARPATAAGAAPTPGHGSLLR